MKKEIAPDFGKYNKVYQVLKSRTDEQIIKGFDLSRDLNGNFWNNLPDEIEALPTDQQEEWVFANYPLAKDLDTVTDMYFTLAAARFPKAFHKFFWDFTDRTFGSFAQYVKEEEEKQNA